MDLQSPSLLPRWCSVARGGGAAVLVGQRAWAPEVVPANANSSLLSLVFKDTSAFQIQWGKSV